MPSTLAGDLSANYGATSVYRTVPCSGPRTESITIRLESRHEVNASLVRNDHCGSLT